MQKEVLVKGSKMRGNKRCTDMYSICIHMGVSNNRGTPKCMVCHGKPYKNGWLGGTTIFGNIHMVINYSPFLLHLMILMSIHFAESHGILDIHAWLATRDIWLIQMEKWFDWETRKPGELILKFSSICPSKNVSWLKLLVQCYLDLCHFLPNKKPMDVEETAAAKILTTLIARDLISCLQKNCGDPLGVFKVQKLIHSFRR